MRAITQWCQRWLTRIESRWAPRAPDVALLDAMGELHDICFWSMDLASGQIHVGRPFAKLVGLPAPSGWNPVDAFKSRIHPDDWVYLVSQCERLRARPAGESYVHVIRVFVGHHRWTSARLIGASWSAVDGQPSSHVVAVLTLNAITPVPAPAPADRSTLADLEGDVIRSLPAGIWRWSRAQRQLYLSQSVIQLLRVPLTQAASQPPWWLNRVHPDDAEALRSAWTVSVKAQSPFFSHECRWRDGEERIRHVIVRASIGYDAQSGTEIHSVTGSVEDVTDYRRMESELHERDQQLRAIFESSPIAYVVLDPQGYIRYVNPAFSLHLGVPASAVVGALEAKLVDVIRVVAVNPDRLSSVRRVEDLVQRIASHRPSVLDVRVGGAIKHLSTEFMHSRSADYTSILVIRDVTQEHQIERMKSQFMSTAAHELRTSMSSILGYSELLHARRPISADVQDTCIASIHQQAQRLTEILDDLLSLSRLESAGIEQFHMRDTDLQTVVQQVATDFKTPEGRCPPVVRLAPAPVHADTSKAYQAILNLVSNAYKYSVQGDVVLQIEPGSATSRQVVLSVRDQGIGIPPEALDKVFDRFYRVDPACSISGTGLGLSIVKEIMLAMDGEVEIESEMGVGTTARLLFKKNIH